MIPIYLSWSYFISNTFSCVLAKSPKLKMSQKVEKVQKAENQKVENSKLGIWDIFYLEYFP